MSTIAERLKREREKRGWTKTHVARLLGIKTVSTYANWEYGYREPDADMLIKLANLYDVSVDYLTGREINGEPVMTKDEFLELYYKLPEEQRFLIREIAKNFRDRLEREKEND